MLWQAIKDVLEILNCDINALEQQLRIANKINGTISVGNEQPGDHVM